jgi:hypothetical protein
LRGRLIDEALDILEVRQVGERRRVHHDIDAARPFRLDLIELLEQRQNLDLLAADLSEGGNQLIEQPLQALEPIPIAEPGRLAFDGGKPGPTFRGDLLQFPKELLYFCGRARHAQITPGDPHPLQHELGIDALDHDRLLPVGGRGQPLDRIAGDLLIDDQAGDQCDADADADAELGPDVEAGEKT